LRAQRALQTPSILKEFAPNMSASITINNAFGNPGKLSQTVKTYQKAQNQCQNTEKLICNL